MKGNKSWKVMEKVKIDDCGYGNCCPECGSVKITRHEQRNLEVNINVVTKNPYIIHNGKMKYMSNRDKAIHFDNADMSGGGGCWSYECRKCGWVSDTFTE